MGLPILDEAMRMMGDFFKSHKYLQLTFLILVLLFASNIVATMMAGFNIACTSEGETRVIDSYFSGLKIMTLRQSVEDVAECSNEESGLLGTSILSNLGSMMLNFVGIDRGSYCSSIIDPDSFDDYVILHSELYEVDLTSFDIKDSLTFGCRGLTPTINFFRIDILNYKLWLLIFLIGELLLLDNYLSGGRQ